MAIDERARHRLFERLEAVLGTEEATILMEHLPPVSWADVATKRDLDALAAITKHDLDALAEANRLEHEAMREAAKRDLDAVEVANRLEHEAMREANRLEHQVLKQELMAALEAGLNKQTRSMMLAMGTLTLSVAGLAFGAAHLI